MGLLSPIETAHFPASAGDGHGRGKNALHLEVDLFSSTIIGTVCIVHVVVLGLANKNHHQRGATMALQRYGKARMLSGLASS